MAECRVRKNVMMGTLSEEMGVRVARSTKDSSAVKMGVGNPPANRISAEMESMSLPRENNATTATKSTVMGAAMSA